MNNTISIGINGFGRIGRALLKESLENTSVRVTAINDPYMTPEYVAYILKHDTAFQRSGTLVEVTDGAVVLNGCFIGVFQKSDPSSIPWKVMYVVDCSGVYTTLTRASSHLASGASRVVIASTSADSPTFVVGVNEDKFKGSMQVISGGSPTGVVLATILRTFYNTLAVENCTFTAIHATTGDQKTVDGTGLKDWRAARGAGNIVPFATGALKTVQKTLQHIPSDAVGGTSLHVPVASGCALDIVLRLSKKTTASDVIGVLEEMSNSEKYKDAVNVSWEPLVSSDVVLSKALCTLDASSVVSIGDRTVKLLFWYDNETGYARSLIDLVVATATTW